jgi:hypothetical protein
MRIKLAGRSDIPRIGEVLHQFVSGLPEGVSMHGVNIYITLKDEQGVEITVTEDGIPVEIIEYDDPIKKIKKQIQAKKIK